MLSFHQPNMLPKPGPHPLKKLPPRCKAAETREMCRRSFTSAAHRSPTGQVDCEVDISGLCARTGFMRLETHILPAWDGVLVADCRPLRTAARLQELANKVFGALPNGPAAKDWKMLKRVVDHMTAQAVEGSMAWHLRDTYEGKPEDCLCLELKAFALYVVGCDYVWLLVLSSWLRLLESKNNLQDPPIMD